MVSKKFNWVLGVPLEEHTKQKHEVLGAYFREYLITRCKHPRQEKFKFAIIDGFCGGGRYACGTEGSPLIFIKVLQETLDEINLNRTVQGIRTPMHFECMLILNDLDPDAFNLIQENLAPLLAQAKENSQRLHIDPIFYCKKFEDLYPNIKIKLKDSGYSNVIFNLDQCGNSKVNEYLIRDIMSYWVSAEIFLTFHISTILIYFSANKDKNRVRLEPAVQAEIDDFIKSEEGLISNARLMGFVEKAIYGYMRSFARNVSTFSLHNNKGWRYWLMHFANSQRAREIYNDVLHTKEYAQAHYGRSGLNMFSFNPKNQGSLYLFDEESRQRARSELYDDVAKMINQNGDAMVFEDFLHEAYSATPAHSKDIRDMIMENPDIEVRKEDGGQRQSANAMNKTDILQLRNQRSMFSMFAPNNTGNNEKQ